MKNLSVLSALLFCAACAKGPDAIPPVSMGNAFAATICKDARAELAIEQETLAALEEKQRRAQTGDAIGVFLVLVPVSSITGHDVEGELATSKGRVIALENRVKSC